MSVISVLRTDRITLKCVCCRFKLYHIKVKQTSTGSLCFKCWHQNCTVQVSSIMINDEADNEIKTFRHKLITITTYSLTGSFQVQTNWYALMQSMQWVQIVNSHWEKPKQHPHTFEGNPQKPKTTQKIHKVIRSANY